LDSALAQRDVIPIEVVAHCLFLFCPVVVGAVFAVVVAVVLVSRFEVVAEEPATVDDVGDDRMVVCLWAERPADPLDLLDFRLLAFADDNR